MLIELAVRDFVIVERLDVEFTAGMTVLTGETGAGKSILVDALSVALGERASGDFIRSGSERAEVSAVFVLSADSAAAAWLCEQQLDDDRQCVLRRTWTRDGRSRAFVNGRPVAVQTLRELADLLVDIHGQHAHQQLMSRDVHRQLVDEHAGNDGLLVECADAHRRVRALQDELDTLRGGNPGDEQAALELACYQLRELEELAPLEGEFQQLQAEHLRLSRGSELVETCARATEMLDGDEVGARAMLFGARRALASFAGIAPALEGVLASLDSASIGLDEASADLATLAADLEPDPARLQTVEHRLDRMHELARKHRSAGHELPALLQTLSEQVTTLEGAGKRMTAISAELTEAERAYRAICERLTARRIKSARRLSDAVSKGLHGLGMPGARFLVAVQSDATRAAAHGHDRVEFLVSTNPGQEPLLLSRVASGGELSRIGLVLETVTVRGSGVPTLIFDEVDAGIGGAVAEVVGRLMQQLSTDRQVLCVTHLPQVASLADQHLFVRKRTHRASATAVLEPVLGERRVEEIARMLSGSRITDRTREHARELLEAGQLPPPASRRASQSPQREQMP